MPSPSFLANLGLFVLTDFLTTTECEQILSELASSPVEEGTVTDGYDSRLDPRFRQVECVDAPRCLMEEIWPRMIGLMPALADHFSRPLNECQSPEFLAYREGDFFRPHTDSSSNEHARDSIRCRQVSAVVFLNSSSTARVSFEGGQLKLYGLLDGPQWKNVGIPVTPQPGMLVAFPSDMLHEVTPVTSGRRFAIVTWFLGPKPERIQLTRTGLDTCADTTPLAKQFGSKHSCQITRLVHHELMSLVSSKLEKCEWPTREDGSIAREMNPTDLAAVNLLNFAANTAEFLDLIRRITGCHEIHSFRGRIYRMMPGGDHFDSWHSDTSERTQDRLVGMSINLGPPYEGGVFHLREESTGGILAELTNSGPGDAILFRISPRLKHMVSPVSGAVPKTAFAGWFLSGDFNYYASIRRTATR
jgi:predicted 2-oxoglutarate/Fe(II)-dependent dioxygenase YbiX